MEVLFIIFAVRMQKIEMRRMRGHLSTFVGFSSMQSIDWMDHTQSGCLHIYIYIYIHTHAHIIPTYLP